MPSKAKAPFTARGTKKQLDALGMTDEYKPTKKKAAKKKEPAKKKGMKKKAEYLMKDGKLTDAGKKRTAARRP